MHFFLCCYTMMAAYTSARQTTKVLPAGMSIRCAPLKPHSSAWAVTDGIVRRPSDSWWPLIYDLSNCTVNTPRDVIWVG